MITQDILARRILSAYGKAIFEYRAKYMRQGRVYYKEGINVYRYRTSAFGALKRRRFIAILLILLLCGLLLFGCAHLFGIEVLGFSFTDFKTHTIVERNISDRSEGYTLFYPAELPDGYKPVSIDEEMETEFSFRNMNGQFLYITETTAENYRVSLSNENCTIDNRSIAGVECTIYSYDNGDATYLLQKEGVMITIEATNLSEDEVSDLISSLEPWENAS